MNNWLNDTNTTSSNGHVSFNPSMDPSMAYLQPPSSINPSQFQNAPYMNGVGRTSSPAFHNPIYQTNSMIPSKRQREDSLGASPRQALGGLPGSRSQTPGHGAGAYPGFNPQANGAQHFPVPPNPFQHLQTGPASNATPSPTVQQLNFGQNGPPQRVSSASPNSFSPQHGPPQMSPAPSDHASRVGTPHDNQNFMQNSNFPGGFNASQFAQGMGGISGQIGMNAQMQLAQQHMHGMNPAQQQYQMQMQARARQIQQAQQARHLNGPGMPNPQLGAVQQSGMAGKGNAQDDFIKQLQAFMAQRGRSVDLNPVICSRPIQLMRLYAFVIKCGGSVKLSKANQWAFVAQHFGFPQVQFAQAAQELQNYWMSNLAPYEAQWIETQQKNRMRMAAQAGGPNPMSPTKAGFPGNDINNVGHQRSQSDLMAMKMDTQMVNNHQSQSNNFLPQAQQKDVQDPTSISPHKHNLSQQFDGNQLNGVLGQVAGLSPQKRPPSSADQLVKQEPESLMPLKKPIEDPFQPEVLPPSRFHGPINVDEMYALGQNVLDIKPINPHGRELGIIDVHALTMAIRSGIHAETRVALDTLVTLSTDAGLQLSLTQCDDLMETLIDCARDQVDFLAEHAAEVSDEMLLTSYEELVRCCKLDTQQFHDVHEFGSVEYDLDRAADRLICITTLIRNLSFYEANFGVLGVAEVITFLTSVVRHLGTKEMLLRTNRNTLDFMKDVIIYLSNLSHSIQLPGKEEALCLLHFLLAFAPAPCPVSANSEKITFTMYNPNVHKYLPSAVDSLAKILARDDPNRVYYRAIFSSDAHATPAYELLTQAFALAISPLPTNRSQSKSTVEARKPFLLQGMLAAEILSGLAPGSDHELAWSWLESEDGFAAYLLRLVALLSSDKSAQRQPPSHGRNGPESDANAYGAISSRAMAILKTLVQKSRVANDRDGVIMVPLGVLPKKETLLGAMLDKDIDSQILRQLCMYAGLED